MKSKEEIQKRIDALRIKEKQIAKELKSCDYTFLDVNITKANFIQSERQILEWVLSDES